MTVAIIDYGVGNLRSVEKAFAATGCEAIVSSDLWDKVHGVLKESPRKRAAHTRARTPAILKGLIFGPTGAAMTPR